MFRDAVTVIRAKSVADKATQKCQGSVLVRNVVTRRLKAFVPLKRLHESKELSRENCWKDLSDLSCTWQSKLLYYKV